MFKWTTVKLLWEFKDINLYRNAQPAQPYQFTEHTQPQHVVSVTPIKNLRMCHSHDNHNHYSHNHRNSYAGLCHNDME